MKTVFFSLQPNKGSYGGGSLFVRNMIIFLHKKKYRITFTLKPPIDIIFLIDPRRGPLKNYNIYDIVIFKRMYPQTKILYRVNENDIKREKSIGIENWIYKTFFQVNHIVFVSHWLQEYYIKKYKLKLKNVSHILNGIDTSIFYPLKNKELDVTKKIKIVTHHYSDNYLKGFHIYNELDKILPHSDFEFTFVGNYNPEYQPKNINVLPCHSGSELAQILREQDIYLTATQNEPGAMHYLEGMSCGLPVLYCEGGGGVKEICQNVGEEFQDIPSFLNKLNLIIENYEEYRGKIDYNFISSKRCCEDYLNLVNNML